MEANTVVEMAVEVWPSEAPLGDFDTWLGGAVSRRSRGAGIAKLVEHLGKRGSADGTLRVAGIHEYLRADLEFSKDVLLPFGDESCVLRKVTDLVRKAIVAEEPIEGFNGSLGRSSLDTMLKRSMDVVPLD